MTVTTAEKKCEILSFEDGLLVVDNECTSKLSISSFAPNILQPIIPNHGLQSEILCRTLLHAHALFSRRFLTIDIDRAKKLSLNALYSMVAMDNCAKNFKAEEQAATKKVQPDFKIQTDVLWKLPSVGNGNITASCKAFFQEAADFEQCLMSIIRLFYPEMKHKNWDELSKMAKDLYGSDDHFCKDLEIAVPNMKLYRRTRNLLVHLDDVKIKIRDFSQQKDGIYYPIIEIDSQMYNIFSFMECAKANLLNAFEAIIVHICTKSLAQTPIVIDLLSADYPLHQHVRFAYGYILNGKFEPFDLLNRYQ